MDTNHVHHYWGHSPALNLSSFASSSSSPLHILQLCPSDCRHTLLSCTRRGKKDDLCFYVYEETPEAIARHAVLLCGLLDRDISIERRAQYFLELHGNVMLHHETASALGKWSRWIENTIVNTAKKQQSNEAYQISHIFDFDRLSYEERDALVDVLHSYRSPGGPAIDHLWDRRCREYYRESYDYRSNKADWDYWMRLCDTNPQNSMVDKSIIHVKEFLSWRLTGVAHAFKDAPPTEPNSTLMSSISTRTKEFKNRYGMDMGRSVRAKGYWGDIISSPYHCFGTWSEDTTLLEKANREFKHTASELSFHNIHKCIECLDAHGMSAKITFLTGDVRKRLFCKKALKGLFDVVYLSFHRAAWIHKDVGLQHLLNSKSAVLCETPRHFLTLSPSQIASFEETVRQLASEQSWVESDRGLPPADLQDPFFVWSQK